MFSWLGGPVVTHQTAVPEYNAFLNLRFCIVDVAFFYLFGAKSLSAMKGQNHLCNATLFSILDILQGL